MIREQNEYKAVKWGFNETTNDFSKLYTFEWKDKFGGHSCTYTHTYTHSSIRLKSLHESLLEYKIHVYYFFLGAGYSNSVTFTIYIYSLEGIMLLEKSKSIHKAWNCLTLRKKIWRILEVSK